METVALSTATVLYVRKMLLEEALCCGKFIKILKFLRNHNILAKGVPAALDLCRQGACTHEPEPEPFSSRSEPITVQASMHPGEKQGSKTSKIVSTGSHFRER